MILSLSIENYKSIEKTSLNFREMNVLIGKNGAGKTTLISVLNLLRKLAGGDNLNHAVNNIAPFGAEFFNLSSDNTTAKFSAEIQSADRQRYLFSFAVTFGNNHGSKVASFYISSESLHLLGGENKEIVYQRNTEEDKIEIPTDSGKIEPLPLNVESDQLVLSKYSLDTVKSVANTLASYSVIWLDTPPRLNKYELVNGNEIDPNTIDGVAVDLFKRDPDSYTKAMEAIANIIPNFTPPEIVNIDDALRRRNSTGAAKMNEDRKKIESFLVSWSDGDYAKNYGVSRISVSGGNSRVIFLILSLYNSQTSTCFVAEEIENGMHLSRVSKLIDQMRMIVKNRKIQLVFTTHNHLILNDLLPHEVVFCKMTKQGSTYERLAETKEYKDVETDLGRPPTSSEVVSSGLLF